MSPTTPPPRARNEPASLHDVSARRWGTILRGTANHDLWAEGLSLAQTTNWYAVPMLENGRIGADAKARLLAVVATMSSPPVVGLRHAVLDDRTMRALWSLGPMWQSELAEHRSCPLDLLETALAGPRTAVPHRSYSVQENILKRSHLPAARRGEILLTTTTIDEWTNILLHHEGTPRDAHRQWLRRAVGRGRWRTRLSEPNRLIAVGPLRRGGDLRAFGWLVRMLWGGDLCDAVESSGRTAGQVRLVLRRIQQDPAGSVARLPESGVRHFWEAVVAHPEFSPRWPEIPGTWAMVAAHAPGPAVAWLTTASAAFSDADRSPFWLPLLTHQDQSVRTAAVLATGAHAPAPAPATATATATNRRPAR
jgi:hypothetical protein